LNLTEHMFWLSLRTELNYAQQNYISMENKKGGKRQGAGRPRNDNKAYMIQCHPNCIKKVRELSKEFSEKEAKRNK